MLFADPLLVLGPQISTLVVKSRDGHRWSSDTPSPGRRGAESSELLLIGDNTAQPFINKQGAVELGIANAPG